MKTYQEWLEDFEVVFSINGESMTGLYLDLCSINELACVQYNTPRMYLDYKDDIMKQQIWSQRRCFVAQVVSISAVVLIATLLCKKAFGCNWLYRLVALAACYGFMHKCILNTAQEPVLETHFLQQ